MRTKFYVENDDCENIFATYSLTAAVRFCVDKKDPSLLIHIGYWNLDGYKDGDTFNSLYKRCEKYLRRAKNKLTK